ncbi:hypothetical protein PybrP1_004819 [[Pythium] brassicae (nom. inval.)]|nr:hypothetical protein PybrP1_004819 [[Pythium] brassicae (nom. inval.)]
MGKKRTTGAHKQATDENNASGGLVPGSTLEDYFHSKQFAARSDAPVSKHLLVGSPTNNAMAAEKEQRAEEKETGESKRDADPELAVARPRTGPDDAKSLADDDAKVGDCKHGDESEDDDMKQGGIDDEDKVKRGGAVAGLHGDDPKASSNREEYEDDYESESPSPDTSVAGMTLSDYLHAKEAKNLEEVRDDDTAASTQAAKKLQHESVAHAAAGGSAPKKLGYPAAAGAKKASAPPTLVSGMSLDHYLGASSPTACENDESGGDPYDSGADSKSPTSKRKKSKHKSGAKSLLSKPAAAGSTGALALAQDDHATPFQKRQAKKLRAKLRQQQTSSSALLVSKAILLADAGVTTTTAITASHSSQSMQTRAVLLTKDKKRLLPHAHPLPKLVASASSTHVLPVHDAGDDGDSSGESEKLPPLAHN